MSEETKFYEIDPSLENYWRAILLFGRNTASYKFALAKALYEIPKNKSTLIKLDILAEPFVKHVTKHLKNCDKQTTSTSSKFLDYCREFNSENSKITKELLIDRTVELSFNNVIDAFHNVHGSELPKRFFIDQRKDKGGILLTDDFYKLSESFQYSNLPAETEARWRLVETAWSLNLPKNLIKITVCEDPSLLLAENRQYRITVTKSRDALNGYQKGKCFYCYREISIDEKEGLADVDHFFPWLLNYCAMGKPINGVANLVLACTECNRGPGGKFARIPSSRLLERLFRRNEYLIVSHHPLRETLIAQTGRTRQNRKTFLQDVYNCAKTTIPTSAWEPQPQGNVASF
jgi:hypothetical protein